MSSENNPNSKAAESRIRLIKNTRELHIARYRITQALETIDSTLRLSSHVQDAPEGWEFAYHPGGKDERITVGKFEEGSHNPNGTIWSSVTVAASYEDVFTGDRLVVDDANNLLLARTALGQCCIVEELVLLRPVPVGTVQGMEVNLIA